VGHRARLVAYANALAGLQPSCCIGTSSVRRSTNTRGTLRVSVSYTDPLEAASCRKHQALPLPAHHDEHPVLAFLFGRHAEHLDLASFLKVGDGSPRRTSSKEGKGELTFEVVIPTHRPFLLVVGIDDDLHDRRVHHGRTRPFPPSFSGKCDCSTKPANTPAFLHCRQHRGLIQPFYLRSSVRPVELRHWR
jgi:hypothetical protein